VAGLTVGLVAGLTTWARVLTCDWACGRLGSGLVFSATWSVTLASAQLWRRGQAPANLLRFLDDARKRQILRTVGPVYQFRHARLQDRLAAPAETARTGVPSIPGMAAGRTLAWAPVAGVLVGRGTSRCRTRLTSYEDRFSAVLGFRPDCSGQDPNPRDVQSDLADPSRRRDLYEIVLEEGTLNDVHELINGTKLVRLWHQMYFRRGSGLHGVR
jgi:hypothetical protein